MYAQLFEEFVTKLVDRITADVSKRLDGGVVATAAQPVTQDQVVEAVKVAVAEDDFSTLVAGEIDLDELAEKVASKVEVEASDVANEISLSDVAAELDYSSIADNLDLDYSQLAEHISASDIAEEIDVSNIEVDASKVANEISMSDLAGEIDLAAVAEEIDYAELAKALLAQFAKAKGVASN